MLWLHYDRDAWVRINTKWSESEKKKRGKSVPVGHIWPPVIPSAGRNMVSSRETRREPDDWAPRSVFRTVGPLRRPLIVLGRGKKTTENSFEAERATASFRLLIEYKFCLCRCSRRQPWKNTLALRLKRRESREGCVGRKGVWAGTHFR